MCFFSKMINLKNLKYYYKKRPLIKSYKTPCMSLQVQGCQKTMSNHPVKSTFLFTSLLRKKGSVTLEAALVFPIFILVIYSVLYFFVIINFENLIQHSLIETSKDVAGYEYLARKGNDIYNALSGDDKKNSGVDEELIKNGVTKAYIYAKVINNEVKDEARNIGAFYGAYGFSMFDSNVNCGDGVMNLVIKYGVKIPVIDNIYLFRCTNRCYLRTWIGKSLVNKDDIVTSKKVYVTENGTVYHLTSTCSHINLSVIKVKFNRVPELRNVNGGRYYSCEKCVKKSLSLDDEVYITTDGKKYHTNKDCGGIVRNVKTIDISEVGDRKLCTRCELNMDK